MAALPVIAIGPCSIAPVKTPFAFPSR